MGLDAFFKPKPKAETDLTAQEQGEEAARNKRHDELKKILTAGGVAAAGVAAIAASPHEEQKNNGPLAQVDMVEAAVQAPEDSPTLGMTSEDAPKPISVTPPNEQAQGQQATLPNERHVVVQFEGGEHTIPVEPEH